MQKRQAWAHPATLALTVYGPTQAALSRRHGDHGPEVLPAYRLENAQTSVVCVADFLLRQFPVRQLGGFDARPVRYNIPDPAYGLEPGWLSGLAQGFVGQVWLAAHYLTGDARYFDAAIQSANVLRVDVESGGVAVVLRDDEVWFEEYAQHGRTPPLVLNGHLLALDFLYWMDLAQPEGPWAQLFGRGVNATVNNIEQFSGRFWSFYDTEGRFANRKYHRFHIRQLARYALHDSTGALDRARKQMVLQLFLPIAALQRILLQPTTLLMSLFLGCFVLFLLLGSLLVRWRAGQNWRPA